MEFADALEATGNSSGFNSVMSDLFLTLSADILVDEVRRVAGKINGVTTMTIAVRIRAIKKRVFIGRCLARAQLSQGTGSYPPGRKG